MPVRKTIPGKDGVYFITFTNSIIGNGKRFIAYDLIAELKEQKEDDILQQLES